MNSSTSFNERKKQLLQALEERYAPVEKSWWQTSGSKFFASNELLKEYPVTTDRPMAVFIAAYPWGIWAFVGFAGIFISSWYYEQLFAKDMWPIVLLAAVIIVLILLNISMQLQKPVLKVDEEGFRYLRNGFYCSWSSVIAMYMEEEQGEDAKNYLHVHYYDAGTDTFFEEIIALNSINEDPEVITAALEYFRCKALQAVPAD
ncbi:hypothetical protein IQ13_2460 [Lacibacter cauensis]|uniref:Uncharacterized protein n=1 Tax=Lacibacter cauensis TaxID=510947 RepID=A0A562SJR0_9BACT|nr:hypothetical protein [Lacibacter cauensis]TWI81442.1 hypothetical protein IQ13_2460 [Lacibacter cauensis]